ncbi:polysaccharide deacetylase family protein [Sungkyunkwania multivorans]|uniref:Polysaccharide deacetylase family protein n=1 Tax=Sungkyunkwania multivorans TaxID=1173618 RepID=A0ABW3CSQ8_9FLAO
MLLVYTHKITPRFSYIFKQLFERVLCVDVGFTTVIEEFIAHSGPKMTYTKQPLGNELYVRSHDLLYQQGITDLTINVQDWEGIPCFFSAGEQSSLPYDIFSASFYLLSRYEEYLPHVKDEHQRFPVTESLAYKHEFIEIPLVDVWAQRFKKLLIQKFPEMEFGERTFEFMPIIDVPSAFAYKKKGLLRSLGGTFQDLFRFKFQKVWYRYKVLFGIERDPFDNFTRFIALNQTFNIKALYFFLVGDFSTYDHNISANKPKFRSLIKSVSDYSEVSLMISYEAATQLELLKTERKRLSEIVHRPIQKARLHYNRLKIPESYRNMVDAEITEDYSMMYPHTFGFRASTCTPFLFYDIGAEIQLPIKIFPVCLEDKTFALMKDLDLVREQFIYMGEMVEKLHGTFSPVFHNYTIGPLEEWMGWRNIYKEVIKRFSA